MALNEITKGMSNAAEMINENFGNILKPEYNEYPINLNGFTGILRVSKVGNIINLSGEYVGAGTTEARGKYIYYLPEGLRPVSRIPIPTTVHPNYATKMQEQFSFLTLYDSNGGLAIDQQNNAGLKFVFNTTYIVK